MRISEGENEQIRQGKRQYEQQRQEEPTEKWRDGGQKQTQWCALSMEKEGKETKEM